MIRVASTSNNWGLWWIIDAFDNNEQNDPTGPTNQVSILEDNGDGTKQVCDLDTGDCYTVRERDGLIERAGHQTTANRRVRVETANGIKQLLNG